MKLARNGLLCAVLGASLYAIAAPAWQEGVTYTAGTVVTYNGKDYKALVTHTAYVGTNWNPASTPTLWAATGGTSSPAPTPAPAATPAPSPSGGSCSSTTWTRGVNYSLGTVVNYNGSYYKLVNTGSNGSDGTDPTISTWYWQPTTCSGGTSPTPVPTPAPTPKPTPAPTPTPSGCSATVWTRGVNYSLGTVVNYNGSYYKLVNTGSNGSDGTDPTISTWYWQPTTCSGGTSPTPTPGTGGGSFIVSEATFNQMFPNRNPFYTYQGLVTALSAYPAFANTGGTTVSKQEAAAFLANVDQETGALQYIREINTNNWPLYCSSGNCGGKQYYGRGPMQLSWDYNYSAAGAALGIDLLNNPDLVATDSAIAWKTAIWYWMTQRGQTARTPHDAMISGAGFGETIRAINGGIECNQAGGTLGNQEMNNRVNFYITFTNLLGVTAGTNLGC
jgi:predicted chitinase